MAIDNKCDMKDLVRLGTEELKSGGEILLSVKRITLTFKLDSKWERTNEEG